MKQLLALMFVLFFSSVTVVAAADMPDVAEHGSCQYCGMFRDKFAHSRMLITYDDGTVVATCSLHCAAVDLANNIDKTPSSIEVGDFDSKVLLNAEEAVWVIGGKIQGVMTARPKWAFADRAEAEAFILENGGELVDFETAVAAAYEDMYRDTRMILEKRKMKHTQIHKQRS